MANRIRNKIITGSREKSRALLDKYCSTTTTGTKVLDFNKVYKMPDDLDVEFNMNFTEGVNLYLTKINPDCEFFGEPGDKLTKEQYKKVAEGIEEIYLFNHSYTKSYIETLLKAHKPDKIEALLKLGKKVYENYLNTGYLCWNDFREKEWGSREKNPTDLRLVDNGKSILYETIGTPAKEIVRKMSEQNPDMKMVLLWAGPQENVGWNFLHGGVVEAEGSFEDFSEDACKLAKDLWVITESEVM